MPPPKPLADATPSWRPAQPLSAPGVVELAAALLLVPAWTKLNRAADPVLTTSVPLMLPSKNVW